jgi:NTP pyrophosphatase (non-canonical NTP hydrolase)
MSGLLEPGSELGLTIEEMQQLAWQNSEDHGFHDNVDVPTKLMLIVAEAAEALEDHRAGNPDSVLESGKPVGIASELADIVIRVGDLAGILDIDLEEAVIRKMKYNAGRPHKHGKAY